MFRMLRKTPRRNPSLRERVEQARAEIERSHAEQARTNGESPRLTVSKLVAAWRDWAAVKPTPPLPAAVAGRVDPVEATLARVRRTPAAASLGTPVERKAAAQPVTPLHSSATRPALRHPASGSAVRPAAVRPSPSRPVAQASAPARIATPFPAKAPAGRKSSDLALTGGLIALGLLCAFFPWYVFMNQDQFGVRAMRFSGERDVGPIPEGAMPAGARILADSETPPRDVPEPPIDSLTTASPASAPQTQAPGPDDQPFPGDGSGASAFRVVHVANGRAMIEDDSGLWIVERGATLPDNSRVRSIEQRDGNWVIVTTDSRVFEMQP